MLRAVLIAVMALLAASCANPPDSSSVPAAPPEEPGSGPFLPTYHPMDGLPVAQIRGRLVEDNGCLWIEIAEGRVLPLWPPGSRIERDGTSLIVANNDGARAEVGTEVIGGGGEFGGPGHLDVVFEAIGEEVPDRCRGDDAYWLVYDVRATGE
jgi:hypothetical protein